MGFRSKEHRNAYFKEYRKKHSKILIARTRKWQKANPDKMKIINARSKEKNKDKIIKYRLDNKERLNESARLGRASSPERYLSKKFSNLKKEKHRNKKHSKYSLLVTRDYLIAMWYTQNGVCSISGKKMEHTPCSPFSASIDRIDSNVGYIEGNIQLVCQAVNFAKNKYSNEEFLYFWNNNSISTDLPSSHS